jgi:hypothetical protein
MKNIGLTLALVVSLSLGLVGCAARSVRSDYAMTPDSTEGIVIVSISHDDAGGRRTKATFFLDGGGLLGGDGKLLRSLPERVPGFTGGSSFEDCYGQVLALSLPAGRHQIDGWSIAANMGLHISPKQKPAPLVFDVVAGKIVYLGNLHAHLLMGKNVFGVTIVGDSTPEVRDERTRDIPIIEESHPQFKGKIVATLLPLGAWTTNSDTVRTIDPILVTPTRR